jgi:hypothetical protein
MSVSDQPGVSREFLASCSIYSPKWAAVTGKRGTLVMQIVFLAIVVVVVLGATGPMWGVHLPFSVPGRVLAYGWPALLVVVGVAVGVDFLWRWRRKYPLAVTGEGITIDGRGDAYPFADAQLGLWSNAGLALHLRRGRRRFVLGGRDCGITPATPLDAPPVPLVDAWLPKSEFEELLSLCGRRRGSAAEGATRCVLFPNPLLIQRMGSFAFVKKQRLTQSLSEPQLFVDIDDEGIRVVDATSNATTASAPLSRVTATPATYRLGGGHVFPSAENVISDAAGQYFSVMPAMAVCIPGAQPVTLGCRDFSGLQRRFSWGDAVPVTNDPPAYAVSAADWRALTEKLGLAR